MNELFASTAFFGMFLTLGLYQLARVINRRGGRGVCDPPLFGTPLWRGGPLPAGTAYEGHH